MEFDDLVKCPWCTNEHDVVKKRIEIHFSKLKQNKDPCVKNLKSCRFNIHHKFHKKDENRHYAECPDAKDFAIREALHQQSVASRANHMSAAFEEHSDNNYLNADCEESWDNECERGNKVSSDVFRVPDDYQALYEQKRFNEEIYSVSPGQATEEQGGSDDVPQMSTADPSVLEEKRARRKAEKKFRQAAEEPKIIDIPQTSENLSTSDNKKLIRKLDKKLKEIRKLEEKAERDSKTALTKEEMEKISRRKDIEEQLEELKLNEA